MKETTEKYQLITNFLYRLEREEYPLGTGAHIRAQELLSRLPDDIPLNDLASHIVPVFARSQSEQERFHGYFEDAFFLLEEINRPDTYKTRRRSKYVKWFILIALLILTPLFYVIYEWATRHTPGNHILPAEWVEPFEVEANRSAQICVRGIPDFGNVIDKANTEGSVQASNEYGSYALLNGCLVYQAGDLLGVADTIPVEMINEFGQGILIKFVPTITAQQEVTDVPLPNAQYLTKKTVPYNEPVDRLILSEPSPWAKFYNEQRAIFITSYWLLAGVLLWLMYSWQRERKEQLDRELVADLETKNSPPYVWNIRLDNREGVSMDDDAGMTLRKLRERAKDDAQRLSIPRTIQKTIKRGGRFAPQFQSLTKPAEYLMLIERRASSDHRAKLYDALYQVFHDNEVLVERYFFDADVRVCFNEEHKDGIKLSELAKKYSGNRLVIMGSGSYLLNPMSGKLAKWTAIFEDWPQRAILTPRPMDCWSKQENRLGELFTVLPAHHTALAHWVDALKTGQHRDFDSWLKQLPQAQTIAVRFDGDTVATLRRYYNTPLIKWIAACAVYPALYWDLTVYLGHLIEDETGEKDLVSVSGLSDIFRLQWFAEGQIPNAARAELLAYLTKEDPDLLAIIRRRLHDVMTQNPPPVNSVAFDEHSMNIALNQWLLAENSRTREIWEKRVEHYLRNGIEADFVMIKELDKKQRSDLDFKLPREWAKYLDDEKDNDYDTTPGEGEKSSPNPFVNNLLWLIPTLILFGLGVYQYNPMGSFACADNNHPFRLQPNADDEQVEYWGAFDNPVYRGNELCIPSDRDLLLCHNHFLLDTLGKMPFDSVEYWLGYLDRIVYEGKNNPKDSIVDAAIKVRKNVAVHYYNLAVDAYNNYYQSNKQDSLEMTLACEYVGYAYQVDAQTEDVDIIRLATECGIYKEQRKILTGKVLDVETGKFVPDAFIDMGEQATHSDNLGAYSIMRDADLGEIAVGRAWYQYQSVQFSDIDRQDTLRNIELIPFKFSARIVDVNGRGIKGVRVENRKCQIKTYTDSKGQFSFKGSPLLPNGKLELSLRLTGFEKKTITLQPEMFLDDRKNPEKFPLRATNKPNEPQPKPNMPEVFMEKGRQGVSWGDKIIVSARFDEIEIYKDPNKAGTYYYILQDGKSYYMLTDEFKAPKGRYLYIGEFKEGLAIAKNNKGLYGYLDRKCRWVIEPKYDSARSFKGGKAQVKEKGKTFYINKKGACVESCYVEAPVKYQLRVISKKLTEIPRFADNNVYITIYGNQGETKEIWLNSLSLRYTFKQGQTTSLILSGKDVGEMESIRIRWESQKNRIENKIGWHLDKVIIIKQGEACTFDFRKWFREKQDAHNASCKITEERGVPDSMDQFVNPPEANPPGNPDNY